jgi:predicted Rossmann fold flavoprotein
MPRCVVIGGGAAGFFAAIRAKTLQPDLSVTILEAARVPLGKVKISGGGRCNVTHACFEPDRLTRFYPRGGRELKGVFSRFAAQDTVAWFTERGVRLKTEPDGRMFPDTDDSQTIIDCLLGAAQRAGVELRTGTPVQELIREEHGFRLRLPQGVEEVTDVVVLATGSSRRAYDWLTRLGHTVVPPVPSLFTFNIQDPRLEGLAGISFPMVKARLLPNADQPLGGGSAAAHPPIEQEGPLLITHWGLSGPVVLRLSAWGARMLHDSGYQAEVCLDLLPEETQQSLQDKLLLARTETPRRQIGGECPLALPKRFWQRLLTVEAELPLDKPWADVPNKPLNRLVAVLKRASFQVVGKGEFKEEFVTAGGVALKEINLKTMESRRVPGLYCVGEVLDIDGLTGGFNFQNAWSTGWLAGEAISNCID